MHPTTDSGSSPSLPAAVPWFLRSSGRLFVTYSCVLALPVTALVLFLGWQAGRLLEDQALKYNALAARGMARTIQTRLSALQGVLESQSRDPDWHRAVAAPDRTDLTRRLRWLAAATPDVTEFLVLDARGREQASHPDLPALHGLDCSQMDWMRTASAGCATVISDVFKDPGRLSSDLVAVVTPIPGPDGRTAGYLVAEESADTLTAWVAGVDPHSERSLGLIDSRGVLSIRSDGAQRAYTLASESPIARQISIRNSTEGAVRMTDPLTGQETVTGYARMRPMPWTVYVTQPAREVLQPARTMRLAAWVFGLICLAALQFLGFRGLDTLRRYHHAVLAARRARDLLLDEIAGIQNSIHQDTGLTGLFGVLAAHVRRAADSDACAILLLDPEGFRVAAAEGFGPAYEGNVLDPDLPILQYLRNARSATVSGAIPGHPERALLPPDTEIRSVICAPLEVGGLVKGLLIVGRRRGLTAGREGVRFVETLAREVAIGAEMFLLYDAMKQMSLTDPLTGCRNRRKFDADVRLEILRSERFDRPLTLVLFDLDWFKKYNDAHGHAAGDELLQELVRLFYREMRGYEGPYRFGGDEFAVLLPESDATAGVFLANRLRAAVGKLRVHGVAESQPGGKLALSLGVAVFPKDADDPDTLFRSADAALYVAKQEGRDRVCVFQAHRHVRDTLRIVRKPPSSAMLPKASAGGAAAS